MIDQERSITHGDNAVHTQVRVSLREIRECTFRALSAHGASHGEASTAARMVLDAELQGHRGIGVVLSDLQRDAWSRDSVQIIDSGPGDRDGGAVVLGDPASNRLLRHAPLAAHLAAAETGRAVYVPGEMVGFSCLDAVLLEVAAATQRPAWLIEPPQQDSSASRVALPDGSLGRGMSQLLADWAGYDLPAGVEEDTGAAGIWLLSSPTVGKPEAPDLTWVSASERVEARSSAAREGRLITASTWWALYAAARRYLVP